MAGDWIPLRLDLDRDPAVIAIAASTGIDEFGVVGRLHRLWSWANQQLTDGQVMGITDDWIDRFVCAPGFTSAMLAAGWLIAADGGIEFPNFDRWNSQSAKRRIERTIRKRAERMRQFGDTVAKDKGRIPRALRAAVHKRDGYQCVNCGWKKTDGPRPANLPAFDRLSIDHIQPESRGGQTVAENLVTLCMGCNQAKSNRTFSEAGMTPNLSHIASDKLATKQRPEKRREEKRRGVFPPPPLNGFAEKCKAAARAAVDAASRRKPR